MTGANAHAKYLHFATHAVINRREPSQTYLLLTGKAAHLSVQDVVENRYGLSSAGTQLVTLSACETSLGGEDPGTAYGSLSRAFAKTGVRAVVASLWPVDDAATRSTMTVFYEQLAKGRSKVEALRNAQLTLRRNPRFSNPYYWAPFILMGE